MCVGSWSLPGLPELRGELAMPLNRAESGSVLVCSVFVKSLKQSHAWSCISTGTASCAQQQAGALWWLLGAPFACLCAAAHACFHPLSPCGLLLV